MRKLAFVAVGSSVLLAGCDLFVNPPVACDSPPLTLELNETTSPARAGLPCAFPDPLLFTVVHAPRVDTKLSKASNLTLAGGSVTVAQATGAVLLCPGIDVACQAGAPAITATIGNDGALKYQGTLSLDALGVNLQPGGTFTSNSVVATENYGPGNSCQVLAKLTLSCEASQK